MRFSSVFEPRQPLRAAQADERAQDRAAPTLPAATPTPQAEPADDLDQRVRQMGEWQLEDW
jgi:hypothetical protein